MTAKPGRSEKLLNPAPAAIPISPSFRTAEYSASTNAGTFPATRIVATTSRWQASIANGSKAANRQGHPLALIRLAIRYRKRTLRFDERSRYHRLSCFGNLGVTANDRR